MGVGTSLIFISHAEEDLPVARWLGAKLKKLSWNPYIAFDDPLGDQRYNSISERVDRALDRALAVIVLVSEVALRSKWVRYEWRSTHERILTKGAGKLIPVWVGGRVPDKWPRALSHYRWIDGRDYQSRLRAVRYINYKLGGFNAVGPEGSGKKIRSAIRILTPDQVRDAYGEIERLDTFSRDGLALAVARSLVSQREQHSKTDADDYIELVLGRLQSSSWGGRSATLGSLLFLIHPETGFNLDPLISDSLLEAAEHALTSDSFLQPETALLIAGFAADRFGCNNSTCFDFAEYFARNQIARPSNPRCVGPSASLVYWLSNRSYPLRVLFPLSNLIPSIKRRLPDSSIMFADPEGTLARATETAKKPPKGLSLSEVDEYDQVTRYMANQWMRNLEIFG
jgi:TIR domain